MRKIIIACYYGTFPAWMDLWVKSCALNPDFDFLLVSDSEIQDLPANIILHHERFSELRNRFCKALGFEVSLESPYKLCDYKPVYGLAFQDLIQGYDFWGHCDIDMVFGRIGHFLTDELFQQYDRLGTYGHLLFYRNTDTINRLFMKRGGVFNYQTVFKGKWYYGLDEMFGMNLICQKHHVKWYDCGHAICLDKSKTHLSNPLCFSGTPNYPNQGVWWDHGRLYHIYLTDDGALRQEEMMYYHFSKTPYASVEYSEHLLFDAERIYPIRDASETLSLLKSSQRSCSSVKNPSRLMRFLRSSWQQQYISVKRVLGLRLAKLNIYL